MFSRTQSKWNAPRYHCSMTARGSYGIVQTYHESIKEVIAGSLGTMLAVKVLQEMATVLSDCIGAVVSYTGTESLLKIVLLYKGVTCDGQRALRNARIPTSDRSRGMNLKHRGT